MWNKDDTGRQNIQLDVDAIALARYNWPGVATLSKLSCITRLRGRARSPPLSRWL